MDQRDIRNVDLNLLLVLDVLLEERNVSRAGRRLALTQSTVSGMLARLRDALDDPLFVRVRHGLRPTPRAEALAVPLRRWLDDARGLIAPVAFEPASWNGSVSISCADYMQEVLLLPFLTDLAREAPALRVALTPLRIDDVAQRLSSRALDLAVTVPEFAPPDLPSRHLFHDEYRVAMRRGHPLAKKRRLSLDDFCRSEHVVVSPTGGSFTTPTDAALHRAGRKRHVRLSVPTFLLVPELLGSSDLIAVLPHRLVASRENALRTFAPPIPIADIDVIAIWHPRVHADAAHAWMRERLARTARRL